MDTAFPYETATAFEAALKDRIRTTAATSPYSIQELQRQFAYDRLLSRTFAANPERWILKGGAGLLARIPGQARHSMDIDLFYQGELNTAVADLQEIGADNTTGDFFTFDIERTAGQVAKGAVGTGLIVVSYLGDKEYQRFSLDVVVASNMTKEPDIVAAPTPVAIPGLLTANYRVYATVDHIADKHAAMIDVYGDGKPSTRYRDLVDLVLIAITQQVDAGELRKAMVSEYAHRGLGMPSSIELPDPSWEEGYAREAAKVPELIQQTASEGLAVAQRLLEPILSGDRILGTWKHNLQQWSDHSEP